MFSNSSFLVVSLFNCTFQEKLLSVAITLLLQYPSHCIVLPLSISHLAHLLHHWPFSLFTVVCSSTLGWLASPTCAAVVLGLRAVGYSLSYLQSLWWTLVQTDGRVRRSRCLLSITERSMWDNVESWVMSWSLFVVDCSFWHLFQEQPLRRFIVGSICSLYMPSCISRREYSYEKENFLYSEKLFWATSVKTPQDVSRRALWVGILNSRNLRRSKLQCLLGKIRIEGNMHVGEQENGWILVSVPGSATEIGRRCISMAHSRELIR